MEGNLYSRERRPCDFSRQVSVEAARDIDRCKLIVLQCRISIQFAALAVEVSPLSVGLGADRDVLAGGHRHGAGDKSRDSGNQHVALGAWDAATPTIRLAVETIPSLAPSTAARNQPMRETSWVWMKCNRAHQRPRALCAALEGRKMPILRG